MFGGPLSADGHDVVAGADDPIYDRMPDTDLLLATTADTRILITFDIGYARLARRWADEGADHAGIILVLGMTQNEFGPVLRSLRGVLTGLPRQEEWRNLLMYAARSSA